MDITCIYLVDIHGSISMDIPCHCISSLMDIRGIFKDIPCICHVYVRGLHIGGRYQAYSRHIPEIGVPDVHTVTCIYICSLRNVDTYMRMFMPVIFNSIFVYTMSVT